MHGRRLVVVALAAASCAGTGPERSLDSFLEGAGLSAGAPVVLVDIDDTVYERAEDRPLAGAAAALRELSHDHLIVYLTARPTYAKVPGVTENRSDSVGFLGESGFPDGPLFTSSLWEFLADGQGGGKVRSFGRLRDFGVERVALAVGDRPHDLDAYLENGHVQVERSVVVLIEAPGEVDPDRAGLSEEVLARLIPGGGPAWPRIVSAYRAGELGAGTWVVSETPVGGDVPPGPVAGARDGPE